MPQAKLDPKKAAKTVAQGAYDRAGTYSFDTNAYNMPNTWTITLDEQARRAQNRQAPLMQGTQINMGGDQSWSQQQQTLAKSLAERAAGRGPSLAQNLLKQGQEGNLRQVRALTAGSTNPALAKALALRNLGQANMQTNQQVANMGLQEQLGATNELANVLNAARGQEQNINIAQAGLENTANQANLQSRLATGAQNDAMTQFYMNQGYSRDAAQQAANIARQQAQQREYLTALQGAMGVAAQPSFGEQLAGSILPGAISGLFSGIGGAIASDERLKKDIESSPEDYDKFIKALAGSKKYKYKREKGEEKNIGHLMPGEKNETQYGPMAQDLLKSDIGKNLVDRTHEDALLIRTYESVPSLMGAIGRIGERLDKLENKSFGKALARKINA